MGRFVFFFQGAFKGLTMFGEAMVHSVTGSKSSQTPRKYELSPPDENGHRPGIVSVVDLKAVSGDHVSDVFECLVFVTTEARVVACDHFSDVFKCLS